MQLTLKRFEEMTLHRVVTQEIQFHIYINTVKSMTSKMAEINTEISSHLQRQCILKLKPAKSLEFSRDYNSLLQTFTKSV
jgi:hypothetical protein